MIEHMLETHAADGDTQLVHVRKVRKAHAARFMDLTEYHVAFRTMKSTPSPDPALQRTSHPGGEVGVTPLQFRKNTDSPQARRRLEHRDNLVVEDIYQGVRSPASARNLFL